MLACTSDKGTVHIFRLKDSVHDAAAPPSASTALSVASGAAADAPTSGGSVALTPAGASSTAAVVSSRSAGSGAASGGTAASAPALLSSTPAGALPSSGTGAAASDADVVYFGAGATGAAGAGGDSNTKSTLSFIKGILPKYFSSEWSFAQFRVPDTRSICAFGQEPHTIIGEANVDYLEKLHSHSLYFLLLRVVVCL
jgi:hypothetical protein